MEGLKHKFEKLKRYVSGSPVEGETYDDAPRVENLPHLVDADGALVAVSSGKHELSPVLSAKYNIKTEPEKSGESDAIDDKI